MNTQNTVAAVSSVRLSTLARLTLAAALATGLCACDDQGGQSAAEDASTCPSGQVFDEDVRHCVFSGEDVLEADDTGALHDSRGDTAATDTELGDDTDAVEVSDVELDDGPNCDEDNDGVWSEACGGDDCDDHASNRSPWLVEVCDHVDNNCDGHINEGLGCWFYAHTGTDLYRVDPIALEVSPPLPMTPHPDEGPDMQWIVDVDTTLDGTLYGVARDYPDSGTVLYRYDDWTRYWSVVGRAPEVLDPSGLAIDSSGLGFVLAGDSTYSIDLDTGAATLVGPLGGALYASGDCVFNKYDSLFMTSKEEGQPDTLVLVDRTTGVGSPVGSVGFDRIYGLTAAWGVLYGLSSEGELIEIDRLTGAGTLLTKFANVSWWGAASSPMR